MLLYGYFAYHCFANVQRGRLDTFRVPRYPGGQATTQRASYAAGATRQHSVQTKRLLGKVRYRLWKRG